MKPGSKKIMPLDYSGLCTDLIHQGSYYYNCIYVNDRYL